MLRTLIALGALLALFATMTLALPTGSTDTDCTQCDDDDDLSSNNPPPSCLSGDAMWDVDGDPGSCDEDAGCAHETSCTWEITATIDKEDCNYVSGPFYRLTPTGLPPVMPSPQSSPGAPEGWSSLDQNEPEASEGCGQDPRLMTIIVGCKCEGASVYSYKQWAQGPIECDDCDLIINPPPR